MALSSVSQLGGAGAGGKAVDEQSQFAAAGGTPPTHLK